MKRTILAIALLVPLAASADIIGSLDEGQSALYTWTTPSFATATSIFDQSWDNAVTIQLGAFGMSPDALSVQVFDSNGNMLPVDPDGSTDGSYGEIQDTFIPPDPGADFTLWISNNFEPSSIPYDLDPQISYGDPPPDLAVALAEQDGKASPVPEPRETWIVGAALIAAMVFRLWIWPRLPVGGSPLAIVKQYIENQKRSER